MSRRNLRFVLAAPPVQMPRLSAPSSVRSKPLPHAHTAQYTKAVSSCASHGTSSCCSAFGRPRHLPATFFAALERIKIKARQQTVERVDRALHHRMVGVTVPEKLGNLATCRHVRQIIPAVSPIAGCSPSRRPEVLRCSRKFDDAPPLVAFPAMYRMPARDTVAGGRRVTTSKSSSCTLERNALVRGERQHLVIIHHGVQGLDPWHRGLHPAQATSSSGMLPKSRLLR